MHDNRRALLVLLFAFSGFSGLIYESLWTHYLKLFLGHAAYAQTLVIGIFMGGMAVGAWLGGRYSVRWKNLLLLYAVVEGVVGLAALVFHELFGLFTALSYERVMPLLGGSPALDLYKWGGAALLILPQSILLGLTFPLMSGGVLRAWPERPGRSLALLYFANSLGGALGILTSGFLLIGLIGLPGTIRLAGVINLAVAATVWRLARGEAALPAPAVDGAADTGRGSGTFRLLLGVSLVTGAASFIYEIGWIRMLSLVLGSSTHSFELMLSAFILGLAGGGLWIHRRIDSLAAPLRFLAAVQVLMGGCALITLPLYSGSFTVMQWLIASLPKSAGGYFLFNLASHGIALAVMLPATFCAGMTLPLITASLLREGYGERSIGAVYGANTVGGICGVFLAVHFGLAYLGLKWLIVAGASLDMALGCLLYWKGAKRGEGRRLAPAALAGLCAFAAIVPFARLDPYRMASGVYRSAELVTPENREILYRKDGKTATVNVVRSPDGIVSISTNGKPDAAIDMAPVGNANSDEDTMTLLGAIPLLLKPGAQAAANIGFGAGLTTHTLLTSPVIRVVDTIEIEEAMVEGAQHFRPRVELAFSDPRSRIHYDDAKAFFAAGGMKYDIIISEPSNPWVSGVAGLFSTEFYRTVRKNLAPDGIFAQWLQLYELDDELAASVFKAVAENFSDYAVYAMTDTNFIVVAGNGVIPSALSPVPLAYPPFAEGLRRIEVRGLQDIEARLLGRKKTLQPFIDGYPVPVNSDFHPLLDLNAVRSRFMRSAAEEFIGLKDDQFPLDELLDGSRPPVRGMTVTPSLYSARTRAYRNAAELRNFLVTGSFNGRDGEVQPEIRELALRLQRLSRDCAPLRDEGEWIETVGYLAGAMLPYLAPDEVENAWANIEAGPCGSAGSPARRNWLALFKAVGRRDAATMADLSWVMLNEPRHTGQETTQYLVAAGMLGNLARGDGEQARRIWTAYGQRLFGSGTVPVLFRQLLAHCPPIR